MQKRISVRNLVEFILRSGSIDSGFSGRNRMEEGARVHRKLQKAEGYLAEVHLTITEKHKGIEFTVEGRADGVILTNGVTIDEIKSTLTPLDMIREDHSPLHWAQAMCYGHIYCVTNGLETIDIRLTYYEMETGGIKRFVRTYSNAALSEFFTELLEKYAVWAHFENNWKETASVSMQALAFPFDSYREGQRDLAVCVYRTISAKGRLFAMAPTGIGKTMSTIFPALKAMGEGSGEKIFYLTAKTITRAAAQEALSKLRSCGLKVKSVTITAKDKICFLEERICKPGYCAYADGHYDRINDALWDILKNCDEVTAEEVSDFAKRHVVCPYELSLDITFWSDIIICDYNYAFDPQAYLRKFFSDGGDYVLLIDEAHNLADRARSMFSASINKRDILEAKRILAGNNDKQPQMQLELSSVATEKKPVPPCAKILTKINKLLLEKWRECEGVEVLTERAQPLQLNALLEQFAFEFSKWLGENADPAQELLQIYFDILSYLNIAETYDESYSMLYEIGAHGQLYVKQFCADPSLRLNERYECVRSVVLFSATLTPSRYFQDVLGGGEESKYLSLPSPFPYENLLLLLADNISTKYKNREQSYEQVAELIYKIASGKEGNYIAYFPSYKYLSEVHLRFCEKYPDVYISIQKPGMSESARDEFLALFENSDETMVAFCVLGGVFSEGIDLIGERLIGSIIVGVGLPQINTELDIVRNHYDERGHGFDFAYRFPGMNKVLQAAGRVIRSEEDRGVILLIDDRFSTGRYTELFPRHWQHWRTVRNEDALQEALDMFWN
ncbi:MAG: ATP-dependent DNA helicase [Oscillospiraceae bacterium]|nr:ATP-dependent DNA helicase [Oscillospiraceae bacterium]